MKKIDYDIILEDCRDYVKYQLKIKRIRKLALKSPAFFYCISFLYLAVMIYFHYDIIYIMLLLAFCITFFCSIFLAYKYDFFHVFQNNFMLGLRVKIIH